MLLFFVAIFHHKKIFVCLIFVVDLPHENILPMKISRITVCLTVILHSFSFSSSTSSSFSSSSSSSSFFFSSSSSSSSFSAAGQKQTLISHGSLYDLITILDNYSTAPDVAAESLGVIACLAEDGKDWYIMAAKLPHISFSPSLHPLAPLFHALLFSNPHTHSRLHFRGCAAALMSAESSC